MNTWTVRGPGFARLVKSGIVILLASATWFGGLATQVAAQGSWALRDLAGQPYPNAFYNSDGGATTVVVTPLGVLDPGGKPPGEFDWAIRGGGDSSVFTWDWIYTVAVDEIGSGDVFVAGSLSGSADFDGTSSNGNGGVDAFVARVDAEGNVLWVQVLRSDFESTAFGADVDSLGNVYVGVWYNGSLEVGSLNAPRSDGAGRGGAGDDVALVKLSGDGAPVWIRTANGPGTDVPLGGVAVDGQDNVYISGRFKSTLTFDSITLESAGGSDVFVANYDTNGRVGWATRFGGRQNYDEPFGMAGLGFGGVVVTGRFESVADFGDDTLVSSGGEDGFVVQVSPSGDVINAERFGGDGGSDIGYGVAVAPDNSYYVGGVVRSGASIGGVAINTKGETDAMIAKFDSFGSLDWVQIFGGSSDDIGRGVAVEADGYVVLTGEFKGTASAGDQQITSSGDFDLFAVRFSPEGLAEFASRAGAGGRDGGGAVAGLANHGVVIGGWVSSGAAVGETMLPVSGVQDFFLSRLATRDPDLGLSEWTWNTNADWIVLSGRTERTLIYDVRENLGANPRAGVITFQSAGEVRTHVVRQEGMWTLRSLSGEPYPQERYNSDGGATTVVVNAPGSIGTGGGSRGELSWAIRGGGDTSVFTWDWVNAVAVDEVGSGDVYVAGSLSGSADFDGTRSDGNGGVDGLIARVTPSGEVVWTQVLRSDFESTAFGVDTDSQGDVYVAVWYNGSLSVGTLNAPRSVNGGRGEAGDDVALVKLSGDGDPIWIRTGNGSGTDVPLGGVAVDGHDRVYISGRFKNSVSFDTVQLQSMGGSDIFLVSFDRNGEVRWGTRFGGRSNFDEPYGLAGVGSGGVVMSGRFESEATFGDESLVSSGGEDGFVARVSDLGQVEWSHRFGSASGSDLGYGVAVGPDETVHVAGVVSPGAEIDGVALNGRGKADAMVARFSATGELDWVRLFAGSDDEIGHAVTVDSDGSVILAGQFRGVVTAANRTLRAAGENDGFLLRLLSNGDEDVVANYGSTGQDGAFALAALPDHGVVVAGWHSNEIHLDIDTLSVRGAQDFFLGRWMTRNPRMDESGWTWSDNADWIVLSSTTPNTLIYDVRRNNGSIPRTGVITFRSEGQVRNHTVEQDGQGFGAPVNPGLSISRDGRLVINLAWEDTISLQLQVAPSLMGPWYPVLLPFSDDRSPYRFNVNEGPTVLLPPGLDPFSEESYFFRLVDLLAEQ